MYGYKTVVDRVVDSEGKDKYGRWLAIIYLDGENINQEHILELPDVDF